VVGVGVTYVTRSLAAAFAYDTVASVCVVDLTFRRPATRGGDAKNAKRKRSKAPNARRTEIPVEVPPTDGAPDAADPAVPGDGTVGGDVGRTPGSEAPGAERQEVEAVPAADEAEPPRQLTLADAIEHGANVDDIIIPTANPRLCMIAAGGVPVARRPALAQGRPLATVLDQLDERFDHVLLDIPPVLVSSDAMNLSQLADACVLVVRQGATSESQVEAALDELQGGEMLGVILNRFDSKIPKRLRRLVGT
jgi:Mrp family chromosome partitioning ATPase